MTRRERIGMVVAGVVSQAARDAGARRIVLLDDDSAEARLAFEWCRAALGDDAVVSVAAEPFASALREMGEELPAQSDDRLADEARRLAARLEAARGEPALLAHPANKTVLLLAGLDMPPEPILPLGDLYATEVQALAGGWSGPAPVRALADIAGGIGMLDGALRAFFDERRPLAEALSLLPEDARGQVVAALEAGRFGRRRVGLVPKLGARTLGVDLFA
ncbi:MAG TPA: hypothetical protein VFQ38_14410 [Longimicrobiales bacterium]|nr:hypothetical protein [Longimicrobiales bacterium]